jgi:RimJ/RimL family protein N-acetyltransferase
MQFELQPALKGELVELRPLREEDFNALYAVASDPLIWEQHPANDRYQPDVFREFFRHAMASGGALAAIEVSTGRIIGSSRFLACRLDRGEVEIGFTFLARSHWGGRYNGEMKRLMLEHAFRFVRTVAFLIGPSNIRSQKAVERIGAVHAGRRTNEVGRMSEVYEITAAAFERSAARARDVRR